MNTATTKNSNAALVLRQMAHQVFCAKTAGATGERAAALIGERFGYSRQLAWIAEGGLAEYNAWHAETLGGKTTLAARSAAIQGWLATRA